MRTETEPLIDVEFTLIAEYPNGGGLWVPTDQLDRYKEYDRRVVHEGKLPTVTHDTPADLKHQIVPQDTQA